MGGSCGGTSTSVAGSGAATSTRTSPLLPSPTLLTSSELVSNVGEGRSSNVGEGSSSVPQHRRSCRKCPIPPRKSVRLSTPANTSGLARTSTVAQDSRDEHGPRPRGGQQQDIMTNQLQQTSTPLLRTREQNRPAAEETKKTPCRHSKIFAHGGAAQDQVPRTPWTSAGRKAGVSQEEQTPQINSPPPARGLEDEHSISFLQDSSATAKNSTSLLTTPSTVQHHFGAPRFGGDAPVLLRRPSPEDRRIIPPKPVHNSTSFRPNPPKESTTKLPRSTTTSTKVVSTGRGGGHSDSKNSFSDYSEESEEWSDDASDDPVRVGRSESKFLHKESAAAGVLLASGEERQVEQSLLSFDC